MAKAAKKTSKHSSLKDFLRRKANPPQSTSYSKKRDKKQSAKPLGWRFTDAGAKALKVKTSARPTALQIEMYKSKKLKNGDRYIYQEARIDKSDRSQKEMFAKGGSIDYMEAEKQFNDYKKKMEDKYGVGFKNSELSEEDFEKYFELRRQKADAYNHSRKAFLGGIGKDKYAKGGILYSVTVYDDFFNKELTGEFVGKTKEAAIKKAREIYAHELDTDPDAIQIVNVVEKHQAGGDIPHGSTRVENTPKFGKGGKMSIELPRTNIFIYSFDKDTNGNSIVRLSFPDEKKFSIQTSGDLPHTHSLKQSGKKVSDLSDSDLTIISKEISDYIKEYGSKSQKGKLKTYYEKGGSIANADYKTEIGHFRGNQKFGRTTKLIEKSTGKVVFEGMGIVSKKDLIKTFLSVAPKFERGGDVGGFNVDNVLKHYAIAALWSSVDPNTEDALDENHDVEDISPKTFADMRKDVEKFLTENKEALEKSELSEEQIGHDFWLSRNGYGSGFFDRGLDDQVEKKLMDSARAFKEINLEVGDDGKIHSMQSYGDGGEINGDLSAFDAWKKTLNKLTPDELKEADPETYMNETDENDVLPDKLKYFHVFSPGYIKEWDLEEGNPNRFTAEIENSAFNAATLDELIPELWQWAKDEFEDVFFANGGSINNPNQGSLFLTETGNKFVSKTPFKLDIHDEVDKVKLDGLLATLRMMPQNYYLASIKKVDAATYEDFKQYGQLMAAAPQLAWYLIYVMQSAVYWISKYVDPSFRESALIGEARKLLSSLGIDEKLLAINDNVKYVGGFSDDNNSTFERGGPTDDNNGEISKDQEIAGEILSQLGGRNRLRIMLGAHDFYAIPNGLQFKIKSRGGNIISIALNAKDLYDVKVGKLVKLNYKIVAEESDVYAENLIDVLEKDTGLAFRLFENGGATDKSGLPAFEMPIIPNIESRQYSEHMLPFRSNNLEGKLLNNGDYVVLSFGYYPIWFYSHKEGKWYSNKDKYCEPTMLHISQSRPTYDAEALSNEELLAKMKNNVIGDQHFDLGGVMTRDLTQGPVADNTLIAHSGASNTTL